MTMLAGRVFHKMTGSGNDFVFVDGRIVPLSAWEARDVQTVCARQTGVGADGLVVLDPGSGLNRVRFHFFNNDGSTAPMCGNAALCAIRLAVKLELASGDDVVLETGSGPVRGRCAPGTSDRSELDLADVTDLAFPDIEKAPGERVIGFATVGVAHVAVLVDDLEAVDLPVRGRELRFHPALPPGGANVNFVAQTALGWAMRTYERGVEAETMACGTGAVCSAAALCQEGTVQLPWQVASRTGLVLSVSGTATEAGIRGPRLEGEGRLVFSGILG